MKNNIIKNAFINASLTAFYIVLIASFLFNAPKIFGPNKEDVVLIPIVMLMLFVFSAALVGVLIFGRPVIWYMEGLKKEALTLLGYTLGILLVITILALFALLLIR